MAAEHTTDPVIADLRRRISDNDRALVGLVNKRLELVSTIKAYKERRDIPFLDADREHWMLAYLHRTNPGPLSAPGLDRLFGEILALTKREVALLEVSDR